ncbi:MAG: hypothetical protein EXR65_01445 [Dehalococcoidia bacterium]|nr:hypothetical protein [Dehalococcoidia bacterium]
MAQLERIPLQRAVAVVRDDSITVRPGRGRLVAPLIQALLAGGAVWLVVQLLARDGPLWLLMLLLVCTLILGPAAILGLVYNVAGSTVSIERAKQAVCFQQGLLGLGLGTAEMVPFSRIDHVAVAGDYEQELTSGERQDFVQWDVRLVKDNGRVLALGTAVAARPFAAEALARANRLAQAVGALTGVEARPAELPAVTAAAAPAAGERVGGAQREAAPAGRRRLHRRRLPPPAGAGEE